MDELDKKGNYISWQNLAMMAFVTVIGLEDIMYNFQNQGMAVITSWLLMMFLYVVPYALIVGHLGSVFNHEGGGLSSWVRTTDGEFLGYFTAWTYWAASIPYVVDTANCLLVDVGWGLTGTDEFEDTKFLSTAMFTAITFVIFILLTLLEHKFSKSMEVLSNIGGWAMFIMTILFVLLAFAGLAKSGGKTATPFTWKTIIPKFDLKYFSTVGMLIYAVNGSELVAPYVTRMKDPKREFPKAMIALALMTCFLTIFGSIALGIYIDANHMPNDLKMNGEYYVFGAMGKQFGVGKLFVYIYGWSSFFYNVALLSVLLDAMTRMLISDTGDHAEVPQEDQQGRPADQRLHSDCLFERLHHGSGDFPARHERHLQLAFELERDHLSGRYLLDFLLLHEGPRQKLLQVSVSLPLH